MPNALVSSASQAPGNVTSPSGLVTTYCRAAWPEPSPYRSTRPIRCSRRLGDHGSRSVHDRVGCLQVEPVLGAAVGHQDPAVLPPLPRRPPRTAAALCLGRVLGDLAVRYPRRRAAASRRRSAPGPQKTTMRLVFPERRKQRLYQGLDLFAGPGLRRRGGRALRLPPVRPAGRAGSSAPPRSVPRESAALLSLPSRQRSASAKILGNAVRPRHQHGENPAVGRRLILGIVIDQPVATVTATGASHPG